MNFYIKFQFSYFFQEPATKVAKIEEEAGDSSNAPTEKITTPNNNGSTTSKNNEQETESATETTNANCTVLFVKHNLLPIANNLRKFIDFNLIYLLMMLAY